MYGLVWRPSCQNVLLLQMLNELDVHIHFARNNGCFAKYECFREYICKPKFLEYISLWTLCVKPLPREVAEMNTVEMHSKDSNYTFNWAEWHCSKLLKPVLIINFLESSPTSCVKIAEGEEPTVTSCIEGRGRSRGPLRIVKSPNLYASFT